jgi:hypothetical protein
LTVLESDIKKLYELMAEREPPPSKINIPAAYRRGRRLRRRRQAGVIAAPLLAAGAVLAIALTALPAGLHGTTPPPASNGAPAVAPQQFDPLIPFASFGWLPDHASLQTTSLLGQTELLVYGPPGVTHVPYILLVAHSAGRCHVTGRELSCSVAPGVTAIPAPVGPQVGVVDGHPAYWAPPQVPKQRKGRPPPLAVLGIQPGTLVWQYAAGGWAALTTETLPDALKIATNVRFGYAGEPHIRFRIQLTGVPADWQVNAVGTAWQDGVLYANDYQITAGHVDAVPEGDYPSTTPFLETGAGAKNACVGLLYYKISTTVINGYQVGLSNNSQSGWPKYELCADDADGTFVWIANGSQPTLSPVSIFGQHMRLLGPDPADWTTQPIA